MKMNSINKLSEKCIHFLNGRFLMYLCGAIPILYYLYVFNLLYACPLLNLTICFFCSQLFSLVNLLYLLEMLFWLGLCCLCCLSFRNARDFEIFWLLNCLGLAWHESLASDAATPSFIFGQL
jgi:hypothetical protein